MIPNQIDLPQIFNFALSVTLLYLAVRVFQLVPSVKGFALAMIFIAAISVVFYLLVIMSDINENNAALTQFLSAVRSFSTYTMLCGMCVMWLKLRPEKLKP
jgi:hypothetical protein